jgi:predicted enzyme related to lactoylglutathione lyase
MRNPFVHGVGGVLSADIAVPDHERELAFYSSILTTGDNPLWRSDLTNNEGTPVIGLGIRTPEYDNLPLQWMPHFQVADVAASAACAIDMGGKELMHGKDDKGQSQWAVLTDQDGAAFGVIPVAPCESDTTQKTERPGRISWLSITVPDASSSRDFYERVVGWIAKPTEAQDSQRRADRFEMTIDNDTAAAGIRQFRKNEDGVPSVWLIHLPVDDLVESLRRVREGGGEVIKESGDSQYAVVRDPIGVYLALQAGH